MHLSRDAIIHLKDLFFPLAHRTGFRAFHKITNLIWYYYCQRQIPRRSRKDIRDLAFFNKYDERAIGLGPFVDKEIVKNFVRGLAPEIGIPETFEIVRSPEGLKQLDLDRPYVAKPAHSSGVAILKPQGGPLSEQEAKRLARVLARNYYLAGGEIQYEHLEKKIIVEEFIGEPPEAPPDYKVSCFEGRALFCSVVLDRYDGQKQVWLDAAGLPVPMHLESHWTRKSVHPYEGPFDLPSNYPEIVSMAEKLSRGFRFCRVDLFTHAGKVFFGEFTFSPNNLLNIHLPLHFNQVDTWLPEEDASPSEPSNP